MSKKRREFPNTYVIIFAIIILCGIATWFVPGGEYVKSQVEVTDAISGDVVLQEVVDYQQVDSNPQTWQIFSALFNGFSKQAGIIIFILIIGGAFWIINGLKAIDAGIFSFLNFTKKLERNRLLKRVGVNNIVMILIMLLFSTFGAVFGMSEETIAFVVILVPLAISMGYDSIVGVMLVYVAAHVGFAGAPLNPFTVGIAQSLAGLPMFSGIEYRTICWLILTVIMMAFVLIYAAKVKKDPTKSIVYNEDSYWREKVTSTDNSVQYYHNKASWFSFGVIAIAILLFTIYYSDKCVITLGSNSYTPVWLMPAVALLFVVFSIASLRKSVHFYILNLLVFTIIYLIIGVLGFKWYITEISALFLALAISSAVAGGYSPNKVANEFLNGAKDILSAAVVVGLAAGIVEILRDGKVIDTILYSMASALDGNSSSVAVGAMYMIQTLINIVIPSASAKAAITIPIMAPFSDLIEVSRQTTVLAFQFGDGFTNMITPTSGVLIAVLAMARIPYAKWFKFIWKFILALIILGMLLLLPTIYMNLAGF
mgnify:FL=1